MVTLVAKGKRKKTLKMENIKSADEEDEDDPIPEGFHLQEESPHCLNMGRSEEYQAYRHEGCIWKDNREHVLGLLSKQTNNTKWCGSRRSTKVNI